MKKNNKCKLCGGTGNIRYEIEYDCTAVKPCPTCCQSEAQTEQKVADHLFNQAIDQTRKTIHPQPTDGLIDFEKEFAEWKIHHKQLPCFFDALAKRHLHSKIKKLLAEQKAKTREDTIDECIRELQRPIQVSSGTWSIPDLYVNSLQSLKSKKP